MGSSQISPFSTLARTHSVDTILPGEFNPKRQLSLVSSLILKSSLVFLLSSLACHDNYTLARRVGSSSFAPRNFKLGCGNRMPRGAISDSPKPWYIAVAPLPRENIEAWEFLGQGWQSTPYRRSSRGTTSSSTGEPGGWSRMRRIAAIAMLLVHCCACPCTPRTEPSSATAARNTARHMGHYRSFANGQWLGTLTFLSLSVGRHAAPPAFEANHHFCGLFLKTSPLYPSRAGRQLGHHLSKDHRQVMCHNVRHI